MKKKKDKKKFRRENLKYSNLILNDLDEFQDEEVIEEKKAEKKLIDKAKHSMKSDLNLQKGRVLEVKANYNCLVQISDKVYEATLSGRLKQIGVTTRNIIAAGDFVNVDLAGEPRIEEILTRENSLSRFSEKSFQTEIIIAANIDQVLITASYREPEISFGLIDRYICAAEISGIRPIICVNKIDLADNIDIVRSECAFYEEAEYTILYTSALTGYGMEELKTVLTNRETVFSGHSGSGKTSLVNKLMPGLDLAEGMVSEYTGKGIHTTTRTRLISWDFGGFLVDTPGIKTFGLKRDDQPLIARIFPGFRDLFISCKFKNCTHLHEKDCAIKKALDSGKYPVERYESYKRIMASLD